MKKRYKMWDAYNKRIREECPTLLEPHHNSIRVIEQLDTSQCLQVSEALKEDLKEPVSCALRTRTYMNLPMKLEMRKDQVANQLTTIPKDSLVMEELKMDFRTPNQISKTIRSGGRGSLTKKHNWDIINVLDSPRLISTPAKSLDSDSQPSKIGETAQRLTQMNFQTLICSVEDFLARLSVLQEEEKDLKILEGHCFLKLQEYLKLKDLKLFCWKMSKAYSITTKGRLSPSSSIRFGNWGMMFNGWFLTANFMESPRTGRECSLSEVLERQVDQKYYLSEKGIQGILKSGFRERQPQNKNDVCGTIKIGGDLKCIIHNTITEATGNRAGSSKEFLRSIDNINKASTQIRRLTPIECERLQGFPDNWNKYGIGEKNELVYLSDTQRYKQMGNAVTTNVIYVIAKHLIK